VAKRCVQSKLLLTAYRKSHNYKKSIGTKMDDLDLCKMWRAAARYEFDSVSKRRSDIVTSFIHLFCAEQFSVV